MYREQANFRYQQKLKEKYASHPSIKRIARHRHVPKHILHAQKEKQVMTESRKRKYVSIQICTTCHPNIPLMMFFIRFLPTLLIFTSFPSLSGLFFAATTLLTPFFPSHLLLPSKCILNIINYFDSLHSFRHLFVSFIPLYHM